jgi:hypothetical protein
MTAIVNAWAWLFRRGAPQSLSTLAKRPRRLPLDRLYIVRVDFEMKQNVAEALKQSLQIATDEFGLRFIVLEPGITLQRFDEL